MVKALADRFAEAFAERMHEYVRKELWGYAPDEAFTPQELIAEPYRASALRPGYPAQPDHTEKETLFPAPGCGSCYRRQASPKVFAMWPGSSYRASMSAIPIPITSVSQDRSAIRWRTMPIASA